MLCHDDILLFALHLCFLLRQSLIGEAESLGKGGSIWSGQTPTVEGHEVQLPRVGLVRVMWLTVPG